jgi:protein-S-isoprenylcysteine O-methyltransferase Ste14
MPWPCRLAFSSLAAIAIGVLAVREMFAASTPLDVRKSATRIVTSGVFQKTRNPIYLSMVLLCAGIAFLADSLWLLVLVPLVSGRSAKRRDRTGGSLS